MKKVLSLVLVLAMVLGTFSFAFAASDDITGHDNEAAMRRLIKFGLVQGDSRGIRPDDTLTRAEAATLVVRALGKENVAKLAVNASAFSDVPADHWAAGYINLASQLKYVNGYPDGTFQPSKTLTYNEALALMVKVLGYAPKAEQSGGWPLGYVVVADDLGITDDTVGFADVPTTRANMFEMLDNSLTLDMMVQVGYGDEMTWEVEEGKNILSEIGFEQVSKERVVAVDKKHGEIEFEKYGEVAVPEDFDYEEVFGLRLNAWINEDGEVAAYDVKDEPIFDAVTWDSKEGELTAVFAEEDYELAEDVALYANGESVKVKDFDKDYDYAKIVLNSDDEVVFVDAYDWDNSIVVEEVDDDDVIGYGEKAEDVKVKDMDEYTIVEDGKTVALDTLEAGDIVYYNKDAAYAEVYNYSVEGKVTAVFKNDFDLDDENYTTDGTYLGEGDDIEDIDLLDKDALDAMKKAEEEVVVFLDRAGNVRHIVGELGEEDTTVVAGYVINDVENIYRDKYNVDVVTEAGEYVEYDVALSNFADADEDKKITFDDDIDIIDEGDIVKITFDEDGDIVEVAKVAGKAESIVANKDSDDIDVSDDKYTAGGNRLKSSAIVFDITVYETSKDTDDIVVSKYSDVDFDVVKAGTVYANTYDDVAYIVVTDNGKEATDYVGFVQDVKELSNGKYRTWIIVDGEEKYDDLKTEYAEGSVVTLSIDEDGNFSNVNPIKKADAEGKIKITSIKYKTFEVGTTKDFELSDIGKIFDTTKDGKNAEKSFDYLEDGMTVKAYYEGTSKRYVEFLLITDVAPEEEEETATEGVVTYINNTATDSKVDIVNGKLTLKSGDANQTINVSYKNDTNKLVSFETADLKLYVEDNETKAEVVAATDNTNDIEVNPGATAELFENDLTLTVGTNAGELNPGKAYTVKLLIKGELQEETLAVYVKSNDETLKSLKIKGEEVGLTDTTLTFAYSTGVDLTKLSKSDVVAVANDDNATIEVTVTPAKKDATDGSDDAKATVVVKVTAEDETVKTYTITVDKAAPADSVAVNQIKVGSKAYDVTGAVASGTVLATDVDKALAGAITLDSGVAMPTEIAVGDIFLADETAKIVGDVTVDVDSKTAVFTVEAENGGTAKVTITFTVTP